MNTSSFPLVLLEWFRQNGRKLPWRETRDPYAVWLSEIILQQTRVEQGRPYWERFMARWPKVEDLAAASEDEVMRQWQGLGYYSRARNLHFAAKQIVALGHFPDTYEEIRKLKGVGDYTAAAVASIAFGIPVAVVDGNVYRVLSRYFGISIPINTTEGKKEFAALAQTQLNTLIPNKEFPAQNKFLSSLLSPLSSEISPLSSKSGKSLSSLLSPLSSKISPLSSKYNQSIMDFGAIQCTPKSPDCAVCPVVDSCEALRSGRVEQLPVKLKTLKIRERHFTYIYIKCKGKIAIHRRGAGDIWQGLWEPLLVEGDSREMLPDGLQMVRKNVRHVLTHQVLLTDFYLKETDERPALPDDYIWIEEAEFDDYAKPRLVEILLESLSAG